MLDRRTGNNHQIEQLFEMVSLIVGPNGVKIAKIFMQKNHVEKKRIKNKLVNNKLVNNKLVNNKLVT